MKYGWLNINITDMWNKPQYNSERVNQLLFSDMVKIHKEKDNFYLVEKYDKYQGWVDKRFISFCSLKSYKQFLILKKYIIKADKISVFKNKKSDNNPHILYYGTILVVSKKKENKAIITLPDNSTLIIPNSSLILIQKKQFLNASQIINEAKRFLGIPYLWGGISSTGFDCSGFTQTILSRFGITIPRDTKDQIEIGEKVSRDKIKTGDLLFFDRHVGFAIGKNKIIHSSVGGGGVKINSLCHSEIDYRQDLDHSFKIARRII